MKILKNERKLLLHNLANSTIEQENFIKEIEPVVAVFIDSQLKEDTFGGYAVSLSVYMPDSENYAMECSNFLTERQTTYNGWTFYPSITNSEDCYAIKDGVLFKHHLFSFLWYK